jgi:hypothetical protein
VYLLFSLVAATAAGYGVYTLMKSQARASANERRDDHGPVARRPPPAPVPEIAPEAALPQPTEPEQRPPVVDEAAGRAAVPPEDIEDPAEDTVLLGRPGVAGVLEVAHVERTVKRYQVRFERCMRRARERSSMRRTLLRVAFLIDRDGRVQQATITGTQNELTTCVLDMIKKLRFDEPGDGRAVSVVYPIGFVPANGGDAEAPAAGDPRN